MAILHSCCHCLSLRRGSILVGFYSVIYFLIFAYLSGPSVIYETLLRFDKDSWKLWMSMNSTYELNNGSDTQLQTPFIGHFISPIPPMDEHEEMFGNPIVYVLSVVDFIIEVIGSLSSFLLIFGLCLDRQTFMIPWLIVSPMHTVIDTFMVIFIVIDHIEEKAGDPWEAAMSNIPLLILDITLNLLNVYMILCVLSQYQEYKMGRGTGAYEAYLSRQYRNERRGFHVTTGLGTNNRGMSGGISNYHRSSQKSDIWLEDLVMEKLDASVAGSCAENSLASRLKKNAEKSASMYGLSQTHRPGKSVVNDESRSSALCFEPRHPTTVSGSSEDSKMLLKPDHSNTKGSPSLRSTYSSIGMEECTVETVAEF